MMSIVNRCFNLTEKGNINIQLHLSCVLQKKYNVWNNMILSKWWQGCNFKVDNQLYLYSIQFFCSFWQWANTVTWRTWWWWCLSWLEWGAAGLPTSRTGILGTTLVRWWRTSMGFRELSRACWTCSRSKHSVCPSVCIKNEQETGLQQKTDNRPERL